MIDKIKGVLEKASWAYVAWFLAVSGVVLITYWLFPEKAESILETIWNLL